MRRKSMIDKDTGPISSRYYSYNSERITDRWSLYGEIFSPYRHKPTRLSLRELKRRSDAETDILRNELVTKSDQPQITQEFSHCLTSNVTAANARIAQLENEFAALEANAAAGRVLLDADEPAF